jgi:2-polyprenyl-3-methyl-5-hydroxy-6-metoxy-1,4-benzoquinol methylase
MVRLAGKEMGRVPLPLPTRRFCIFLRHTDGDGRTRSRLTGQYLAITREIDEKYYSGDDYVNYEAQSSGEPQMVLDLLHKYDARGPVLEIGCATGGMIQALSTRGFDTYGVDIS